MMQEIRRIKGGLYGRVNPRWAYSPPTARASNRSANDPQVSVDGGVV